MCGGCVLRQPFSLCSGFRPHIMDALSEANGTFAIQLFKILCQDNPSHNVFYSPVSISSALAMVFLGAKGNTAAQMAQVSLLLTPQLGLPFRLLGSITQLRTSGSRTAIKPEGRGAECVHTPVLISVQWGCLGTKTQRRRLGVSFTEIIFLNRRSH